MNSNLFRILVIFTCCLFSCIEGQSQVTCSLTDSTLPAQSSTIGSRPRGQIVNRVRSASGIIPSWNRKGVFNRDAAYSYNEGRPLAGLFGPDFELTANVFGGWNRIVGFGPDSEGDDIFDDDLAVGIAYGRRHNKRLRSEFEFTWRSNESAAEGFGLSIPEPLSGEVQVYSIMKNFIIDVEVPNKFATPYVGIGIGYANVETDFNRNSGVTLENSSSFAWQPLGGVSIQLSPRAFYYVEYRYFSTTDLEIAQFGVLQENMTYNAHNLFMGMRFEF